MQIIIVLLVSLASIAAFMDSEPYIHQQDNALAILASWSITLTLIGALVIRVNAAEQGTNPVVISILLIVINVVVFALGAITCVISTKGQVDDPIGVDDVDDDEDEDENEEQNTDQEEKEYNKESDNNIRNQSSGDLELTIVNPLAIKSNENKHFKDDKYFRKPFNNGDDRDSDDEY